MSKQRHRKNEVADAIKYAEDHYSTPRNPGNHAKQIIRAVDRCGHGKGNAEEE